MENTWKCYLHFLITTIIFVRLLEARHSSSYIVHGNPAAPITIDGSMMNAGRYPYIASIEMKKNARHRCAGVIVKMDVVLTVAHCTVGQIPTDLRVRAGVLDLDDILTENSQVIRVKRILNHPDYKALGINLNNDISIMWLYAKFNPTTFVNMIKLGSGDYSDEASFTLGWGKNERGESTTLLMRGNLNVMKRPTCKKAFYSYPKYSVTNSMVCAIHSQKKQATCSGDSGGPLVVQKNKNPKDDVLVGLTSWGFHTKTTRRFGNHVKITQECDANFPSVFSNIDHFRDWILENI